MASEITYAEVKFKNESNSLRTYSESPAAPREKPIHDLSKPGSPSLLFTSLMVLLLLLAITFLVAFIIYFQKYSQLLGEKKAARNIAHNELNCTKSVLPMEGKNTTIGQRALTLELIEVDLSILAPEDKVWSCCPKDWKLFGSHCYLVPTVTSSASWNKSEENCSRMGAHLVVIQSQEEQDYITGILDTHAAYFIGLWDTGHQQWQWVDQTPYEESVTFWHIDEPDYKKCVILDRH
ncbi:C-type lectin domain family 4 member A isoform X1 [Mus pahari]|uniref:C-type lectin domain family 4 member A isoform X1 n=1 Tax=Mus pahari TaxID=10093 RepID=UPI000A304723|nr:C-type lectin domain family 4 member A isoform X1 [Mus pahari]